MIDAHNHLHDPRFNGQQDEVISVMKQQGITGCVVNGTCESDWPAVARLADRHPGFIHPSFGLHPWKVSERSEQWIDNLRGFLGDYPHAAIGECGLDRWMKNPDPAAQHRIFKDQLNLALALERPVTIHCLKAWGPLLDELQGMPELPTFLLHSYGGSIEFARQCLPLGARFSFSGYFLHPRKAAVRAVFSQLPSDRVLVETDAPDMTPPSPEFPLDSLNHPANLPQISRELSALCKVPQEQFKQNAQVFFRIGT